MKINIKQIVDSNGWKSIKFNTNVNFIRINKCICCDADLSTIIRVTDKKNTSAVDLGCCPLCGFVTYRDRPRHKWIVDFYKTTWNMSEYGTNLINSKSTSTKLTKILNMLELSKEKLICEIGTGRGGNFIALNNNGYGNLVGVENSVHRAKALSSALPNVSVYTGGFEEELVQKNLQAHGKYDVIYTAHVLEHVCDPREIVRLCSNLQDKGAYLIISVPNFIKESTIGIGLFLPHLHSFTSNSLRQLLLKNDYSIVDDSFTSEFELTIVAKKGMSICNNNGSDNRDYIDNAKNKITADLDLIRIPPMKAVYYWLSKKDSSKRGIIVLSDMLFFSFFQLIYLKFRDRKKGYRSLVIEKNDDSSEILTFVWGDNMTFFYK